MKCKKIFCCIALFLVWAILGVATLWAAAALYFDVRISWLQLPLALIYGLGILAVWIFVRRPWKMVVTAAGFGLVLAWWFSLQPSNNRDWLPNVAVLPYADITGSQVAIYNIRNCDYRTESDYTPHWETRTVRLSQLMGIDLAVDGPGTSDLAPLVMAVVGCLAVGLLVLFGTVAFTSYGLFWWWFALLQWTVGAGWLKAPPASAVATVLLFWGVLTFFLWIVSFRLSKAVFSVFLLLGITFLLLAGGDFGLGTGMVGGYFGLLTGVDAMVVAFIEVLNATANRVVIPLGAPILKS